MLWLCTDRQIEGVGSRYLRSFSMLLISEDVGIVSVGFVSVHFEVV